jgi:glycine/D-amino acid oxidase-like deaminating enzyme
MAEHTSDFLIFGQGIAGATLAWQLHRRRASVTAVDRDAGPSASRIAAGLITPITGKRLARSWRLDEVYAAAVEFYRWAEAQTGSALLTQRPSLRLFQDEAERDEYCKRLHSILNGLVREPTEPINPEWFSAPLGGFEMPSAARLDVSSYLDSTRAFFERRSQFLSADIDAVHDLEFSSEGVRLPRLNLSVRSVVFCRGYDAGCDPWFGGIRFNAAKGEILTLRIPGLREDRIVHRGIWLAPLGGDRFRAGSTYVWDDLQPIPTAAGRDAIAARLQAFLRLPFEVLDQEAAVRPVIDAGYPVLGRHPRQPQLAYFNGLGSKGSLLAPFFAAQLASCLLGERQPDPEVDVRRYLGTGA